MSRLLSLSLPVAVGAWVVLVACSSVPDVIYVDDVEGGPPPADAGTDVARDTSVAVDATPPLDASPTESCPNRPPPYATTCCGTVPCAGECAAQCAACASTCGNGEACCAKRNNVVCRPRDGFVCN